VRKVERSAEIQIIARASQISSSAKDKDDFDVVDGDDEGDFRSLRRLKRLGPYPPTPDSVFRAPFSANSALLSVPNSGPNPTSTSTPFYNEQSELHPSLVMHAGTLTRHANCWRGSP